jgi:hypothetical protein
MPKLCEVIGGTKTKFYFQGTICRKCMLAVLWTVRLGVTKVGNQAKPLMYSEKSCISYQFRADVQTYGYQPQYMADNDAADTDMCSQKMLGCCYLSGKGNEILFRITFHCHL